MKPVKQIIEDETTFKILLDGIAMLSVEYDEDKKKWIISSEDKELQIYEEWEYPKEEKDKVVAKALTLSCNHTRSHLKLNRILGIQEIGLLILCVCSAVAVSSNSLPVHIIVAVDIFLLSVNFLYRAYVEKKLIYVVAHIVYIMFLVTWLNRILRLFLM